MIRILILCAGTYLLVIVGCALFQRKLLFMPSHDKIHNGLPEWRQGGQLIGHSRIAASPGVIWLFLHGNAGQAADRTYILPVFSSKDSVYILEYPGYGSRPGSPSRAAFDAAARQAFELLKVQFPKTPICVAAESIGSGPASYLSTIPNPPNKIVLIVPFDELSRVAAKHYPFLPVKLLLRDNWDNIALLRDYQGQVEIFGSHSDTIIPVSHAKALAESKASAVFHEIQEGHNDWSDSSLVKIRYLQ